ncbi:hypothetical protein [Streptomyces sp. NEAU-H3]|uniref:hypothetical protein n=1 Tax=Streptomyces sp. NEAU-H3 TaxID=2720636 RepID=UPI00143AFABC|nr:hypothetical protein [Streptomyces sp. NEAU-H3]NJA59401.1 hypothetical protein [Streptomyces sp. NEAU-H3]
MTLHRSDSTELPSRIIGLLFYVGMTIGFVYAFNFLWVLVFGGGLMPFWKVLLIAVLGTVVEAVLGRWDRRAGRRRSGDTA